MRNVSSRLFVALLAASCLAGSAVAQESTKPPSSEKVVRAAALFNEGKVAEATELLELAVKEEPENGEAYSWLGFIYLQREMPSQAEAALTRAHELLPNDVEVLVNLGNAQLANGNDEGALASYQRITVAKPAMFEAWYNVGVLELKRQNFGAAKTALTVAQDLQPADPFVKNNLGAAFMGLKDVAGASNAFKAASDLKTDNREFAHNASHALLMGGQLDVSQRYLERAVAAGDTDPDLVLALGQRYLQQNRVADAIKVFELAEPAIEGKDGYWFNMGIAQERKGDYTSAEAAYRRSIEQGFQVAGARNNLGLMLFKRGQYVPARTQFEALYAMNRSNTGARLNLAAAMQKTGDLKGAVALWEAHLKAQPKDHETRAVLGSVQWQLDMREPAFKNFQTVVKANPNSAIAHNGIGLYHLEATKLDEAEKSLRLAIRADRGYAPAYNNLAVTYERMNRLKEAKYFLDMAVKLDPNSSEIKSNLKRVNSRLGVRA